MALQTNTLFSSTRAASRRGLVKPTLPLKSACESRTYCKHGLRIARQAVDADNKSAGSRRPDGSTLSYAPHRPGLMDALSRTAETISSVKFFTGCHEVCIFSLKCTIGIRAAPGAAVTAFRSLGLIG